MHASTPAPSGGSSAGAVYGVIGIVLLCVAAAALWFTLRGCGGSPTSSAARDGGARAFARRDAGSTALSEVQIEIPPVEEDAGPAETGQITKTRIIRVVSGGQWECAGEISVSEARRVAREYEPTARSCYERALRRNNVLAGTVVIDVRVGGNGAVNGVRAGGSLRDPDVRTCIRNIANRWRFPSPSHGSCAVVRVPFTFRPRP